MPYYTKTCHYPNFQSSSLSTLFTTEVAIVVSVIDIVRYVITSHYVQLVVWRHMNLSAADDIRADSCDCYVVTYVNQSRSNGVMRRTCLSGMASGVMDHSNNEYTHAQRPTPQSISAVNQTVTGVPYT